MPDRARSDRTQPTVSVVLAVLNDEQTLGAQLDALAGQTYEGCWELVVADNGCTDRSMAVVDDARDRLPAVRQLRAAARRNDAHPKNRAVEAARGDIVVSCDADDVVAAGWMAALVRALATSDIAYGINDFESLNPPEVNRWHWLTRAGPVRVATGGGNIGCWRQVWEDLGGWNEDLVSGADAEFRMRAEDAGRRIGIAEDAMVLIRRRSTLGATARQAFAAGFGLAQRVALHPHWAGRETGLARIHRMQVLAFVLVAWPIALVRPGSRGLWVRVAASLAGRLWARLHPRWRGGARDDGGRTGAGTPVPASEGPVGTG